MKQNHTNADIILHELARSAAIELSESRLDSPILLWNGDRGYAVQPEGAEIGGNFRMILAQEDLDFQMYGEPIAKCADDAACWIVENQEHWFNVPEALAFIDALISTNWLSLRLGIVDGERHPISAPLERSLAVQHIVEECEKRGLDVRYFEGRQNTRAITSDGQVPLVILIF